METTLQVPLRNLGQSSTKISALGLGCWQFSKGKGMGGKFWPTMNQTDINEIVKMSLDGGINWFDTAEMYGKGESEKALSTALDNSGKEAEAALVATKWWPMFRKAPSITQTINDRLEALNGRKIDLYQVHQPLSFSSAREEMGRMVRLLKRNKIKHVGVSNFDVRRMTEASDSLEAMGYSLASNQVKYSLLDRRIEKNGVLEAAKERGITIIAYSPLEQGILSGKFHKDPELVKNIKGPRRFTPYFKESGLEKTKPLVDLLEEKAKKYGVSQTQIALNWLIHFHGETVVAIPGASKKHHVEENVGAMQFTLSKEDMDEIDQESRKIARFE